MPLLTCSPECKEREKGPVMECVGWYKSSYSSDDGNCVEVADLSGGTAVRDSKDPAGPVLTFTSVAWSAFTRGVRAGEFS
jgi:hypothetical protein